MKNDNYSKVFIVDPSPGEVFKTISNVRNWWTGLYGEEINGDSTKLNEEFTFRAGGGAHYSKQQLIEFLPSKKIVWLVTDSNLSFLEDKKEWTGTKICFDIFEKEGKTEVRFTHVGLVPQIECYDSCSDAWGQYLKRLLQTLIKK